MNLSDELERLDALRSRGVLSDEELARAKARLLDGSGAATPSSPLLAALNALRRSRSERWIAGICGGLARATGAEVWLWRLAFSLLFFCGGAGLIIYVLLWIFVPPEEALAVVGP